ncbi:MAG TPA: hypothetical protein VHS31_14820 [Tepidisphaeraceae bacterium]|jgi:hypothetical protein|nr:hypothetical protein [Tepidisphaeraceae bacterium]
MRKAVLIAGSSMLIALYSIGCEYNHQQLQPMNDFFPASGEVRDVQRAERVQEASGARFDATLSPAHFDKGELNSLGREKLSLMLDDDDANNPITIYLNVAADDEFKAARQDSIVAYLKEQGLEETQIAFKEGPNPATYSPAAGGLLRLAKTETGIAGGTSSYGGSSSDTSGAGSSDSTASSPAK